MASRRLRKLVVAALAVVLMATPALIFVETEAPPARAHQTSHVPVRRLYHLINTKRISLDRRTVDPRTFLHRYAQTRSNAMARRHDLWHNACGGCGEIVGVVPHLLVANGSAWTIYTAWLQSPGHRAIMLDPRANRIGCAWRGDGRGFDYWTCEFRYR